MYDLLTPLTDEHLQSIILFADLFCFYVCFGYLLCVHIRSLIASMERFIFCVLFVVVSYIVFLFNYH